jgi:hypothetical protein
MSPEQPFRPDEALDLRAVRGTAVPLRVEFLHPAVRGGGSGPLAELVKHRRRVALDLLLLAHAAWPLRTSNGLLASAAAWARAVGVEQDNGTRALISRSWSWLEQQRLVATSSQGRLRAVEILREDGSGRPWQHPFDEHEPYLQLPHAYWFGGFAGDLSLPAKAMLLIGASLQSGRRPYFEFPISRGASWYGLTERTVRTGLRELQEQRLLRTWAEVRETDRSPVGSTLDRRYRLNEIEVIAGRRQS